MATVNYDGRTENGVPYVARLYSTNYRYTCIVDDLNSLQPARQTVLSGSGSVTQYSIGSRQLTKSVLNATQLLSLWDKLMAEKAAIEGAGRSRKSVGIVLRDW